MHRVDYEATGTPRDTSRHTSRRDLRDDFPGDSIRDRGAEPTVYSDAGQRQFEQRRELGAVRQWVQRGNVRRTFRHEQRVGGSGHLYGASERAESRHRDVNCDVRSR